MAQAAAGGALAQLTRLDLDSNKIGDKGLEAFSGALATGAMAHLRDLYLGNNSMSDKAKDTMKTAMSNRGGNVHL